MLVNCGLSSLSWAAEVDRGKLQNAEQRLNEGNAAAVAQDYTKAIGLYGEGLKLLEDSAGGQRVSDVPQDLQSRYPALILELSRNYIVAHFQNGQALAKQGSEKIDKAVQLVQQAQRKDPALIKEGSHELQEAATYFDLTVQLIENLGRNTPENRAALDNNVRFVSSWPTAPSQSGAVGFSEYYRGGCYLNLAMIAAYLGAIKEEHEYVGKMRPLGQPALEKMYEQFKLETDAVLRALYSKEET